MTENRIRSKFVRSFLDVFIMAALNSTPKYGYQIMALIHQDFGVLLSPGTLYPLLHSLEDDGLIKSNTDGSKIVYTIGTKGREKYWNAMSTIRLIFEKMSNFIKNNGEREIPLV